MYWLVALVAGVALVGCGKPAPSSVPAAAASDAAMPGVAITDAALPADAVVDAAVPSVAIVDAPLAWSDERARLTLEYRRRHSDPAAADLAIAPRIIVLHYTGGGSAKGTRAYFDHVRIEASRKALARAGAANVSAHFVIDRDGTIYRLQPETRFARHCIGLNHVAIGIENVGDEKRFPLTDEQVTANASLIRHLVARFPITHVLGHHEVMGFRDHDYYVELDTSYTNRKSDPGTRFMARVRERIADLGLAGAR